MRLVEEPAASGPGSGLPERALAAIRVDGGEPVPVDDRVDAGREEPGVRAAHRSCPGPEDLVAALRPESSAAIKGVAVRAVGKLLDHRQAPGAAFAPGRAGEDR